MPDKFPPQRIISLVPSQTELLYDLGLDKEVIGITKFCVHPPEWFRTKTRVGGTKNIHPEIIRELQPDLIIANKEENVKDQVEPLQDLAQVYVSDISNLEDALEMIQQVGALTNRSEKADALVTTIRERFGALGTTIRERFSTLGTTIRQDFSTLGKPIHLPCAYLIWRNPWMVAGGDTFINDMLERAGFVNVFKDRFRYPGIDITELSACKVVLLSSEPYPFKERHLEEIRALAPQARILLVDGEMFSWYGSRLQYAPDYFREMFL